MTYCETCGAKLSADAVFCEQCGAKTGTSRPQSISPPTVTPSATNNSTIHDRPSVFPTSPLDSDAKQTPISKTPQGCLQLIIAGLIHLIVTFFQQSAIMDEPTFRLGFTSIFFGILPLVIGALFYLAKPLHYKKLVVASYIDLLCIIGWWYPAIGIINFWDVESTMRFYGIPIIVTALVAIGTLRISIACLRRQKTVS